MPQSILEPGANCCAVAAARRIAFLVDGEAYFRAFYRAALLARHSIRILGWDFNSRTRLHFDSAGPDDPPAQLGDFLNWLARRRPGLHVRALTWDFPLVFGADREVRALYGFGWTPARRVHMRYDDTHPFAGSQHQKVVVIDDAIAFAGGIDLTLGRWDSREHRPHDERRGAGTDCPPVHDIMMAVDGDAARALGALSRARWRDATGEKLSACPPPRHDPWPDGLRIDAKDVDVGIARTLPPRGETPAVTEIERLYLDMIAAARRSVYAENQYFTSPVIAGALEKRLAEPNGPEVILVLRLLSHGWLEEHTMHLLRTRVLAQLRQADRHGRLRVLYPHVPGLPEGACLNMHAKLMIVDDALLRIGSSNLSSRSMGVDSECDLVIEALEREDVAGAIRTLREHLLAEHLGCRAEDLQARTRGLCATIDALSAPAGSDARTLRKLEDSREWPDAALELASVGDPAEPIARDFLELAPAEEEEDAAERPAWGRLAVVAAAIAGMAAVWRFTPLAEAVTPDAAIDWAREFGSQPWAPFVVALAYTPAAFLLFPRPLITLAAVIAFGSWMGFVVALAGVVLSAAATYVSGMRMRRDTVRRLAGRRLDRMIDVLRRHGLLAMTLLRLVPLAPFAVEGIVAGAVRLRLWHLLAGTAIGMLPGTLATTLFGEQIEAAFSEGGEVNWWVVAGIGALLVGGTFAVRRWFRRMAGGTVAAQPR